MKKIVLLLAGLMFAGLFSIANAHGVGGGGGDKLGPEWKTDGDVCKPSEIFEVKAITKEHEIPMYSKNWVEWDTKFNGVITKVELIPGCSPNIKKHDVGWRGYPRA